MNVHCKNERLFSIAYTIRQILSIFNTRVFPFCLKKLSGGRLLIGGAIVLILLAVSCGKNKQLYRHFISFPSYMWYREAQLIYRVPIETPVPNASTILTVRHATEFPYQDLRIIMTVTSPMGKQFSQNYTIPVLDANGTRLGKGLGDYWDVKYVLQPQTNFTETGVYEYQISHDMADAAVLLLIDMGLTVEIPKK